ncbi:MAG: orc1/cdc6 family replication initiation protein [Candidatus Caldarchaeum sp.]|nr:orc1/cdc6 family replication initiation protein [Candidatus Caldarchaeum sp.]MDW8063526.1 orc1/cdc6 family replication initiation protein [Candidatus Caldarchaeum sp.]
MVKTNNYYHHDEITVLYRKETGGEDPLEEIIRRHSQNINPIIIKHDLLRSEYVPSFLPHRAQHIKAVGNVLATVLKAVKPSNLFLYGKTGTGKTAVCRHVFNRLSEAVSEKGLNVKFVYVNCRLAGTEYRVLAELCAAAGVNVPFTGVSKGELFRRFQSNASRSNTSFVICFDEVDALVKDFGDDLLYELTRSGLGNGWVSLVGISNDLLFKDMLDPRVLSSLSEEEVVFQPYTATELSDILWNRAEAALRPGSVGDDVIKLCAALAAAEHGDARRALDLLRVSAEVAEREGAEKIEEHHVRTAQGLIERGRVKEVISSLPLHSRIVLLAIYVSSKKGLETTSGTIYNIYREFCATLGVEPLTDRRVSTLVSELDMLGIIACDLVSYGRHGRTRRIKPTIAFDEVAEILGKDDTLSGFLDGLS